MYSIIRHIEPVVERRARNSKAILLTGPRQVGKSTLFKHLFSSANQVTFDDDLMLAQASEDVGLFLMNNPCPLMIDEVQKCPSIFNRLKIVLDNTDKLSNFYLTGSQKLQLMENVSDSLAGRISIVELEGLSLREINGVNFNRHFVPTEEYLSEREKHLKKYGADIWTTIHRGSYPELYANPEREWVDYYQSYVKTYLERDVNKLIKTKNHLTFVRFMTAVAARTGQIINYANIASELDVSEVTVKEWISILEKSGIVYILKPYTASVLKRAVKTPKLYFFDTGLVAFLTKYSSPEILANGALSGHIIENYTVMEIIKSYSNAAKDPLFWYYRDKDNKEVDMIIESDGVLHPLEIKRSVNPGTELIRAFNVLERSTVPKGVGGIICMRPELSAVNSENLIIPIWYI